MKIGLKEILALLIIIFIGALLLMIATNKEKKGDQKEEATTAKLVEDSTDFYTVNDIINRYIDAIKNGNKAEIIGMLDKNYIKEHHIKQSNVLDNVINLSDNNYSYDSQSMYYVEVSKNIYKFYIYGELNVETLSSEEKVDDLYYGVILDKEKRVFSIIPDFDSLFKEAEHEN